MKEKTLKLAGAIAHRIAGTVVYQLTTIIYAVGGRKALDKCTNWLIQKFKEEA